MNSEIKISSGNFSNTLSHETNGDEVRTLKNRRKFHDQNYRKEFKKYTVAE